MELVVATESTWSLRAWLCARLANIKCRETVIDLSGTGYQSVLLKHSPSGLLPVLKTGSLIIHDSLAITEYFNELTSGALYPMALEERAMARSLCAEMHSGFTHVKAACPFTLEPMSVSQDWPVEMQRELTRIEAIFSQASGDFMFSKVGAVDAYYAVLAYRLQTYGIYFMGDAGKYQQSLLNWYPLKEAIQRAEQWRAMHL